MYMVFGGKTRRKEPIMNTKGYVDGYSYRDRIGWYVLC
jgi:hypothetical protein